MDQNSIATAVEPPVSAEGVTLRDNEFDALRELVYRESGIALSPVKRQLLASRLSRRLRHFGYRTFAEYIDHLTRRDRSGDERQRMVNCITTNKTEFFREPHHFDFLRDVAVPAWLSRSGRGPVRIWSAGCSTGMEPYTIAITLMERLGPIGVGFEVIATDIDNDVLAKAERGVYPEEDVQPVPLAWQPKYFLRGFGTDAGTVRVRPELRARVSFRRVNLTEPGWSVRPGLDAIFCRNVVIYFDRPTQQQLFERYADHLAPDGFLFIGHAENLHGITDRFVPLGATVYRPVGGARGAAAVAAPVPVTVTNPPPRPAPAAGEDSEVSLVAGEVFVSREPVAVRTLVGSCVAACLFDPVAGVGGMNHFLLPGGEGGEDRSARFGIHAMELLINQIMAAGGDRRRLRSKVFGGGALIAGAGGGATVGERNAQFVLRFLEAEGIPVAGQLLGAPNGLRVFFRPNSGRAWVKPVADAQLQTVADDERRYEGRVAAEVTRPRPGAVTLF